jgi:hypothetical protein
MADHDTTPITETTPEPAGGNGVDGAVEADDTTEAGALAEVAEHTTTHTTHTSDDHQNGEHTSTNGEHATTTESSTTPPPPSDDQIVDAMREIIKSHNVSEITLRMLMGLLEKEFNQELTSRKAFVKEKIGVLVAEQSGEGEGEEEEEEEGEGEEAAGEEADTNGDEEGEGKEPEGLLRMLLHIFMNIINYHYRPQDEQIRGGSAEVADGTDKAWAWDGEGYKRQGEWSCTSQAYQTKETQVNRW